jgi:anthranilate synthase/aminodeoxychorismate synthase-like glutamine amidotransferase
MLGVCLGHQAIAAAFGGLVVPAPEPMHGRTSEIAHDERGIFCDLPTPFAACRYHSLVVDRATLPSCLAVTAETPEGVIMGVRHRERPLWGLQFHPESVLTEHGYGLLGNFLRLAGLPVRDKPPTIDDEILRNTVIVPPLPREPVTF